MNGFDFVKLNITILSAIQLFILITLQKKKIPFVNVRIEIHGETRNDQRIGEEEEEKKKNSKNNKHAIRNTVLLPPICSIKLKAH